MPDDLFENEDDEAIEEILAHAEAMHKLVDEYADEHDIPVYVVAQLMFDIAVKHRMMAYCLETAKPSGSGLKTELDRCYRDLAGLFRESKKSADDFVRSAKALIEIAEKDIEMAEGEEDETKGGR